MTQGATTGGYSQNGGLTRIWTLLGMALILVYCITPLIHRNVSLQSVRGDLQAIGKDWTLVAVLAVIGFAGQKRAAGFFGLRVPSRRDLRSMLLVLVAAAILTALVNSLPLVQSSLRSIPKFDFAGIPFAVRVGLVLTAGVCEEFIFRGFIIEQIGEWTGSRAAGAGISLVLFVVPHAWLYGFTVALVIPATLGGALTVLYVWRRNLPVCMLMHAILDGTMLLLVPALARSHGG